MAEVTTPPTNPRTIVLRCDSFESKPIEGKVAATKTLIPGMLVEKTTAGALPYGDYQPHSTQGGRFEPIIVKEPYVADVPGQTFQGGTIDDTIAAGEHFFGHMAQPGDEMYMFLKASGSAVTLASFLQSAGNGDLELVTSTNQGKFKALEAVTPGSTRTRCRVRYVG